MTEDSKSHPQPGVGPEHRSAAPVPDPTSGEQPAHASGWSANSAASETSDARTRTYGTAGDSAPYGQVGPYAGHDTPTGGPSLTAGWMDDSAPPARADRPFRTGLVVGAVALALVSGGIGGAVGALTTRVDDGRAPVVNALDAPVPSISNATNAPAGSTQAVAQKVLPSVVMIKVASARAEGEGSGVVLSSDGLILTNNHVAAGGGPNARLQVMFSDGSSAPATLVGADPVSDLAVIQASGKSGLTPIELGTSATLQVGEPVVAVGSPLGLAGTVTTGIVSALNRPVVTSGEGAEAGPMANPVIDAIQTDAAINPGNSGGALVDGSGRLVGINTAIATLGPTEIVGGQTGSIGLGFAIPVDQARRVADELIETGTATYAQIGLTVSDPAQRISGAEVHEVVADGPADRAGIPPGAIVTKLDDRPIDSANALVAAVRSRQPGDRVKVTYTDARGNDARTVEVTLAGVAAGGGR
ncbi:S1C family serine protease [Nocardia sp. CNY236]|uniref:S1C family serine protease n=1 Tax=Nocardia sp. CNY236 TaxID=1169152 RepID=UPI0009DE1825|nr:trypsin-like peptidase domain-containing protein [Nocardia sp. CNY236]